ncbi:MAG: VOC family protein [Culicoidibacterales bacterium]
MSIFPYLNFRKNAVEAINFYEEALDGSQKVVMLFGDTPSDPSFPMDDQTKKLVMNASLSIAGTVVMFSDVPDFMDQSHMLGNNITLAIDLDDSERLTRYFTNLAVGGQIGMPLQETFWSPLYGQVVDKFGISWQLNYTPAVNSLTK